MTDCGNATRHCDWRFRCCLCSEIVALLWVEVQWMQMWRRSRRPAVYSHAVGLTLLCVCLDILCPEICFKGHERCLTASACCSSTDVKVFASFPALWKISGAFTALECLITDDTFYCCWDMLPVRTLSGKKCIRVTKFRWDQTLYFYFHPSPNIFLIYLCSCVLTYCSFYATSRHL